MNISLYVGAKKSAHTHLSICTDNDMIMRGACNHS